MTRDEFVGLALHLATNTHETQRQGPVPVLQESLVSRMGPMRDLPDFSEEFADAWPAYAIVLVPNLKYLDITMSNDITLLPSVILEATKCDGERREPQGDSSTTRHHPLQDAAGTPSSPSVAERPLSQLEGIIVRRVYEVKGALRMQLIEELLLLPRLKKIYGFHVDFNTSLSTRTSRTSSSLVHVDVRDAVADAAGILDILRTCPLLQTLRIQWGDSMVGDSELEWNAVGRALKENGPNLEVLDLNCQYYLDYEMGDPSRSVRRP
ncbi:hypothetical protein PG993_005869 [Apiospora rasikravindrae]|uniref:Uncharacterized protein n=1 Tax=Apiospora rasikravindrae TaxID=990691 RepID=A0ABR1TA06_9PEZI